MVKRFTSKALELPDPGSAFCRADLIFYGVDHSADTFEGRIFFNAPPRIQQSAGRDHPSYVGSLFVFGHGDCAGDVGHCEIPTERDPFDFRLPHHLTPGPSIITVTEAIRELIESGAKKVKLTVLVTPRDRTAKSLLAFETVRLVTYV